MKAASLFAGLGGFDLALDRLGIATTVQAEIDRAAQRVLRARFPDARLEPDATRADLRGVPLLPAPRPWPSTATVVMRQVRAVDRETADEAADEEAVAEAAGDA